MQPSSWYSLLAWSMVSEYIMSLHQLKQTMKTPLVTPSQSSMPTQKQPEGWQIWVDRGGTFTDILALSPEGKWSSHKLLSENPEHYNDAVVEGVKQLLGTRQDSAINELRMGTTVATNALLERKGEPTLLVVTQGFADLLLIRSQHRRHLFRQRIEPNQPLYHKVIEARERVDANGNVIQSLDMKAIEAQLKKACNEGIQSIAVSLMHACMNPEHELAIAKLAQDLGFQQITLSHQINPFPKLLPRTDTALADAYLSPVLNRYLNQLKNHLPDAPLLLMQSNGDLTEAKLFSGKDAVLSGPAGGIVAMARTAQQLGFHKVVGFDMGGTSTDVSLFEGAFELSNDNTIADINLRVPMLKVHTVAAGGGSKLKFDGQRLQVGPESAGAHPGPVSYGKGGELAVTDINVLLGKIRPEYFPQVFGPDGKQPLNVEACKTAFQSLADRVNQITGQQQSLQEIASDYLTIAVSNMANAIKTISTQKGIELNDFLLNAFGGAGGQHACRVADELGIESIMLHQQSSLLSAFGMGCAHIGQEQALAINRPLSKQALQQINHQASEVFTQHQQQFATTHSFSDDQQQLEHSVILQLSYPESESTISLTMDNEVALRKKFTQAHQQQFGFTLEHSPIEIKRAVIQTKIQRSLPQLPAATFTVKKPELHPVWFDNQWLTTPFMPIETVEPESMIEGPAILYDTHTTLVIEPNWCGKKTGEGHFLLQRKQAKNAIDKNSTQLTPARLEIFNNLFMYIAEQMGAVLQQTAFSVNIKERLDFSCALFDGSGNLIANAPHMPVHLGSMSDCVRHVINNNGDVQPGDVFMMNSPYHGGTHLPDITVISPVFVDQHIRYWVASRGHHADIGGITPGSMPASSNHIEQEGIVIENFKLVAKHQLREKELNKLLCDHPYPVRNFAQTLADLKAQIAANQRGIQELAKAVEYYGEKTVTAYMAYVQDNAEQSILKAIEHLKPGDFEYPMDCGAVIRLKVEKEERRITFDFRNTSPQQNNNFNAPFSVTRAAVLYVLRSLVEEDIPLNEGCMRPVNILVEPRSMLNPEYPAAVVAGNVETSQVITDCIFGALGIQAGAQGTMNNITFGNARFQYYETIAGGSGAGADYHGTSAVHTHMTNSRITDPEIIEQRFPVILKEFSIRRGSGGKGKYCGGDGAVRKIQFLEACTLSILSNNRQHRPFGLNQGEAGQSGINRLFKANGELHELAASIETDIEPGDCLEVLTPGGGGFGKRDQ